MRLRVEFTTEPFQGTFDGEGEPPAHVTASLDALRAAGVEADFGPFGTAASGDSEAVYAAVVAVLRAAFAHGAERVTLQVEQPDG